MKCRKILSAVMAILTLCIHTPGMLTSHIPSLTLIAYAEEIDESLEYRSVGDHIEITGFHGGKYELVIPAEIDGLPVTKIAPGACKGNTVLYEVFLPVTIKEIGDEAFSGCTALHQFHFSPILQTIGKRTFYGCSGLKVMIIPDTVTEIGDEAFAACNLQNVIMPNGLYTIRQGLFAQNGSLDTISIPAGVERIEKQAFSGCDALQYVCYKGSCDAWAVLPVGSGNESLSNGTILCDYNKEKVERSHTYNPVDDTWSFLNKDVGYYVLSDERLAEMKIGMSNTEAAQIDAIWNQLKGLEYQGTCAGMAVTSMLAAAGILDPADYDTDATCLHEVELSDEVRELLTYYLVLQTSDSFYEGDIYSDYKLYYYLEHGIPVYFSFSSIIKEEDGSTSPFGHAVVAYGVEEGHYEFDGTVFTKKILTYDSNVNEENGRDGCIYWGAENADWPEMMAYIPYLAERGAVKIAPDPMVCSLDALNLHGLNRGEAYAEPEQKPAILRSSALPSEYTVQNYAPDHAENKTIADCHAGMAGMCQAISFPDAESCYVIELNDSQELDCSMSYEHWWYSVNGPQMESAAFEPDGAVSVTGKDTAYTLTMVADEDFHPTSYYEISVSGKNAQQLGISQTDSGYVICGDHLQNVHVETVNDSAQIDLAFSTEAGSVLVYETAGNAIAVNADLDGDGTFETALSVDIAYSLGDVNGDGHVDASDASSILIYAAGYGASGFSEYLDDAQKCRADVDGDGEISAVDASLVLCYAAETGLGTFSGTLKAFLDVQTEG